MSVVRRRIIGLLIALVLANVCAFAQDVGTPAATPPRILIDLPDSIRSDSVWIRYSLTGPGSNGAIVEREANLRRYVIDAIIGVKPAQQAKIVVYAPGCQFKAYTIDLDGVSDVSERFQCDSLPSKTLHGFLPPAQIPSRKFPEKNLAVSGEFEPDWVCDFFLQQRRLGGAIVTGGSCLGASIPLGVVGDFDISNGGTFEITIPDFARDPLFNGTGSVPRFGNFGEILLGVRDKKGDKKIDLGGWGIKPENAGPESGLIVQGEYPNPVRFTTIR